MKKMVSVILSVCLLLILLPTTVFAADQTAEAGARIVEKSYDESTQILTVDMQIKLPNAVGITSVATMISYDSSKLTLIVEDYTAGEKEQVPTSTRTTLADTCTPATVALKTVNNALYSFIDSALYGTGNRAGLLITLGKSTPGMASHTSQNTTDWLSIYSLRFKVSGPAATTLDSTSLRIADPNLENELVKHTYDNAQTNNYYTVAVVDGGTGLEYYFGKMQDNPDEELNEMKHLMAAEGNNTATYPGSDNAPSLPPASVTTAPTAKTELKYNGTEQALLSFVGTPNGGTMQYSLNGTTWIDTVPTGKDAKTYTVYYKVKGDSDHSDSAVAHISAKIEPKEISGVTIGTIENQSYTGGAITPNLVVTDGTATLTKGTDYTVSGTDNIYVGTNTAKLTITGKGNYTGTKNANFTIVAANQTPTFTTPKSLVTGGAMLDLRDLVSGAKGDMTFTIASGTAATLNTRYTLTSTGTTGVVKISVSIAAKDVDGDGNNEYNTFSKSEAITVNVVDKTPASVTTAPTAKPNLKYNGSEQELVTAGETNDGTMQYSLDSSPWSTAIPTAKDAGTYSVQYKVKGDGYHADSTPKTLSVTIGPKEVTVSGITANNKKYDGNDSATVNAAGATFTGMVAGDNLTITATGKFTDANVGNGKTVNLTLGALGGTSATNYKLAATGNQATTTANITVKEVKLTGGINATNRSYVKDNKTVTLTKGILTFDGLVSGETLDVNIPATGTISDAKVGTYNVTYSGVTLKDGTTGKASNYKLVSPLPTVTVNITKATGGTLAAYNFQQKYTDLTAKTITPDYSDLPAGQIWTYSTPTPTTSGTAAVTGTSIGADTGVLSYTLTAGAKDNTVKWTVTISSHNYADFTKDVILTLTDKDDQAALTLTGGTTVVYGQTLQLGTTGGSGTGAVTYAVTNGTGEATIDATGKLTPVKSGTVTVTATKAADANYNPVTSAPVTITINKAKPAGAPVYTAITAEGKTLVDAALGIGTIKPTAGTLEWVDDAGNVLADNTAVEANKSYSWVFTPTDTDNYTTLTGSIQLWHKSTGGRYYYSSSNSSGTATITAVLTAKDAKSATDYTSGIYGLTFRSTADFSGFKGVKVDGKTIGKDNYVAESNNGSIEVYLKAAYLKTLAVGRHTLTIMATGGNASIDFTIGGVNTAPKTFDAGIAVYVTMAVASVTGMAWMGKKRED